MSKFEHALELLIEENGYYVSNIEEYPEYIRILGHSDLSGIVFKFNMSYPKDTEIPIGSSYFDIVLEKINKEIGEVKNIAKELTQVKEVEHKFNKDITEELVAAIEHNESLIFSENTFGRCTGKTSSILYLARLYNLPILVEHRQVKEILEKLDKNVTVYSRETGIPNLFDTGKDTILVDEARDETVNIAYRLGFNVVGLIKQQ